MITQGLKKKHLFCLFGEMGVFLFVGTGQEHVKNAKVELTEAIINGRVDKIDIYFKFNGQTFE